MNSRFFRGGILSALVAGLVLVGIGVWIWLGKSGVQSRSREGSPTERRTLDAAQVTPPEDAAQAGAQPASKPSQAEAAKKGAQPHGEKMANLDKRSPRAMVPVADQQKAVEALRKKVPGVEVGFDPVTGSPQQINATGRFLTGAAAAAPGGDAYASVRQFIDDNAALFGHGGAALAGSRVTREDVTARSGMRTVVWQQEVDGIPVYNTILKANLTKDGALITLGSHFMRDAVAATQMNAPARAALEARPTVSVEKAVSLAAANLSDEVAPEQAVAASPPLGAERKQQFTAPKLSDTVARLSWLPMSADSARLAWDVTLMSLKHGEMFRILVDAQTGAVLMRTSLTADISNASYMVYADGTTLQPLDSPTPLSPGHSTPQSTQPGVANRTLITTPALDITASPLGWINDGVTETLGNNVDAHTDTNADNIADLPRPNGEAGRVFNFALDLSQPPSTYRDAVTTQLFYLCNWYHDRLYTLGFTESAGNFQQNNFGNGGLGGDAILADAQDGSGSNNANFSTPSDGSSGRMQMYVFTGPAPDRDGDLDAEIVFHEYTHGLSNRLVGGGVGISALQTGGMGEGWSDFYALCLLSQPAANPPENVNGNYAAGGYATYQLAGLTENYYYGIRRYPYSTDMTKNPLTLKDIDPTQASSHVGIPRSPIIGSTANEVHNIGEVWCVALWEARANLVNKLGAAAGNEMILQLVTDGMKLSPSNPTFLQARDAIIQADVVDNEGANRNELWAAFAKRGMGAGATVPANSTTTGVVESYDLPDDLSVTPAGAFVAMGDAGGPFTPTANIYTLTNYGLASLNWTAVDDAAWLDLSAASGSLADGATATLTATLNAAAASMADGLYTATITFTNTVTSVAFTRIFYLRIGQVDYFTEVFDTSAHDIDNQSFLFTPNTSASGYSVLREPVTAFFTDPTGGASLPMIDDTSVQVTLAGGQQVQLYGVSYASFFVGSNGYITFTAADTEYEESADTHFSLPRVSALMDDLYPSTGQVTWRQTADRVAVTWQGVAQYDSPAPNDFQIELFFDGRIRITNLGIAATDGLIGLSRGTGVPADFIESDFSGYAYFLLGVTIPAAATEGSAAVTGTVSASPAPASDLVVSLVSSDTTGATVPATATILAGQTSATFPITIINDTNLDGTQNATISVTASGYQDASAVIAVQDNETATLAVNVVPTTTVEGAVSVGGTVTLSSAPDSAVTVTLTSSDPTAAQVPSTVSIPAGETSADFTIAIIDDTKINGTHLATITAHVANWTDGAANISIQDNEGTDISVSLPLSVVEGGAGGGTVTVSGTVSSALTVSLASDTPRLTVPASVTIAAGFTSAAFTATAPNNALLDGAQSATVTASASGFTSGNANMSVLDDDAHHYAFSTIASPQNKAVPFSVTITAKDASNATITGYAGKPNLTASGSGGAAPISPANASGFVSGVWTGNVTVNTQDNSVVLTATDTSGHSGASNAFDVAGPPDYFTELFTGAKQNDVSNQSFLFTPNGSASFYQVQRVPVTSFPTDPAGGASLSLSDDSSVQITPSGGAQVKLYGTSYSSAHVGSNGYITFGSGETVFTETLGGHFGKPRVAALFDDLDPGQTGTITWKQLADRIAVTYQGVPEFSTFNSNSFQIELFFDGRIRITCLGIAATDGLIGLSLGQGVPAAFVQSDFSTYLSGPPTVVTVAATGVAVSSATLNGTVNPDGQVTTAHFDYGPTIGYGSTASVTLTPNDGGISQVVTANLTNLPPGTTYHFRATASSPGGTANGGDLTFTTLSLQQNWRLQYFGTTENSGDAADTADPDRDGGNNFFEYVAGLLPNDPFSRFNVRVQPVPGQPEQKAVIFSPLVAADGRTYVVKCKGNLTDPTWTTLTSFSTSDNGAERTVTDLAAGSGAKFYTVEILLP